VTGGYCSGRASATTTVMTVAMATESCERIVFFMRSVSSRPSGLPNTLNSIPKKSYWATFVFSVTVRYDVHHSAICIFHPTICL
jgi:hypothetical protein